MKLLYPDQDVVEPLFRQPRPVVGTFAFLEMVDILSLVLHHDEQAVLTAVELSLSEGVPTKTHVLNLLHRLVDGKVIGGPPLDTLQALALRHEPKANVERYDGLRSQIAGGRHAS